MKCFLICVFACLSMIAPLQAQLIRSYGAKIAYTYANQNYKHSMYNVVQPDRRSGFNAAGYIEWLNIPFVSVVTQVEYAQRGRTIVTTIFYEPDPSYHREMIDRDRLDYLSVPIMGKLRMPIGNFSPYIAAGPRIDFLLGYKIDNEFKRPFYDAFKKTNLGATVGLGSEVHAPILPVTLFLEARYNFDLADAYSTEYLKIRNNSFDVWLGVGF